MGFARAYLLELLEPDRAELSSSEAYAADLRQAVEAYLIACRIDGQQGTQGQGASGR